MISVSVTFFAFFDSHKVATITNPAIINKKVGVGTLSERKPILKASGEIPVPTQAEYDCHPAIGTPIKLTKSFPENAKANAKVPMMITNL